MKRFWLLHFSLVCLAACGQAAFPMAADCSTVKYYSPDSSETQRLVAAFIEDFKTQWPTEYMAFEQVWGMYQFGDYLVIEGMVTQEEIDLIVVQKTDEIYRMAARYTTTSSRRHSEGEIREILLQQAPNAPALLYACLDLIRFAIWDTGSNPVKTPCTTPATSDWR